MPVAPGGPSKRFLFLLLLVVSSILAFTFVSSFRNQAQGVRHPNNGQAALAAHRVEVSFVPNAFSLGVASKQADIFHLDRAGDAKRRHNHAEIG